MNFVSLYKEVQGHYEGLLVTVYLQSSVDSMKLYCISVPTQKVNYGGSKDTTMNVIIACLHTNHRNGCIYPSDDALCMLLFVYF